MSSRNYYSRYLSGECQAVCNELTALAELSPLDAQEAQRVAEELMRRVKANIEIIVAHLHELGYSFSVYCDPEDTGGEQVPMVSPDDRTQSHIEALEARVGNVPISLKAFWTVVGSIFLTGVCTGWPDMLDPLVVYPPEVAIDELDLYDEEDQESAIVDIPISPDDYHKDNVSGGPCYAAKLPDAGFDFRLRYLADEPYFIEYLRHTILRCGGFPGLEDKSAQRISAASLTNGLIPF